MRVKKDSTLQKLSCDHYSEITRLTKEIATYAKKIEPELALYRHYLKMTTDSKDRRHLIRVTLK